MNNNLDRIIDEFAVDESEAVQDATVALVRLREAEAKELDAQMWDTLNKQAAEAIARIAVQIAVRDFVRDFIKEHEAK